MCLDCRKAVSRCYCHLVVPVHSGPKVILLVHSREDRRRRALNTARMVFRCLEEAELFVGRDFHGHRRLSGLLGNPELAPFLLYPGPAAIRPQDPQVERILGGRRMLLVVPDGTWHQARQILRFNPELAALPSLGLDPSGPGVMTFRRQPADGCLCTLEAVHQALVSLACCPSGPPEALRAMMGALRHVVDEQVALGGVPASGWVRDPPNR